VKFIFATTEPHKLPSTILSRCQRFDLTRIPLSLLISKLKKIASQLQIEIEDPVYSLIAERADGSLRDAESLFERVIAGQEGIIDLKNVYDLLGYFNLDLLEELDACIGQKNIKNVFLIADKLFHSGKDIKIFFDQFRHHLRHIICSKLELSGFIKNYPLTPSSLDCYTLDEATYLLEVLTEQLKTTSFDKKLDTEALLLHMVQSKNRISLHSILDQLESQLCVLAADWAAIVISSQNANHQ
jgi:DNA polymerase-3 subunit gamma/tau